MCSLLNIKGVVLPLTEERADLVGHSETEDYFGEVVVSQNIKNISTLSYDHDITIGNEVRKGIAEAHRAAARVSDLFLPDGELREVHSEAAGVSDLFILNGERNGKANDRCRHF